MERRRRRDDDDERRTMTNGLRASRSFAVVVSLCRCVAVLLFHRHAARQVCEEGGRGRVRLLPWSPWSFGAVVTVPFPSRTHSTPLAFLVVHHDVGKGDLELALRQMRGSWPQCIVARTCPCSWPSTSPLVPRGPGDTCLHTWRFCVGAWRAARTCAGSGKLVHSVR